MTTFQSDRFEQELALRIRKARTEAGFTQEIVAAHLCLLVDDVDEIENGQRAITAIELRNFANLVDKSSQSFLETDNSLVQSVMGETIPDAEPGLPSQNFHINISRIRNEDGYSTKLAFSRRVRRYYAIGLVMDALWMLQAATQESIWTGDGGQEVEDEG